MLVRDLQSFQTIQVLFQTHTHVYFTKSSSCTHEITVFMEKPCQTSGIVNYEKDLMVCTCIKLSAQQNFLRNLRLDESR